MVALERQCWGNSQYSRRECLEITNIPYSISNNDLEETNLKIFDKLPSKFFDKLGMKIELSNIEDSHWLESNKPKKVIIKLLGVEMLISFGKKISWREWIFA